MQIGVGGAYLLMQLMAAAITDQPSAKRSKTDSSSARTWGSRKYCPHCEEVVSVKTYKYHRRLFYNKVSNLS